MTNEEYTEMAQALHDRDLELAAEAATLVSDYETAIQAATATLQTFKNGLPTVPQASKTTVRSTIDSALAQITNSGTQLTYVKSMLDTLNTPVAPVTAPAPTPTA